MLEVVFVRLHMDGELAGPLWGEFVANIVEGIDDSVFPRLDGYVYSSIIRCSMVYASPVIQMLYI